MSNPDIRLVCGSCGAEIEYSEKIRIVLDNIRKKTNEFMLNEAEVEELVVAAIIKGNEFSGWRKIGGKWRCPNCTIGKSDVIVGKFHW